MSASSPQPPCKKARVSNKVESSSVFKKPGIVRLVDSGEEAYIYETLFQSHSGFLNNALKKEWKEGQERAITLHEVEVTEFRIWV